MGTIKTAHQAHLQQKSSFPAIHVQHRNSLSHPESRKTRDPAQRGNQGVARATYLRTRDHRNHSFSRVTVLYPEKRPSKYSCRKSTCWMVLFLGSFGAVSMGVFIWLLLNAEITIFVFPSPVPAPCNCCFFCGSVRAISNGSWEVKSRWGELPVASRFFGVICIWWYRSYCRLRYISAVRLELFKVSFSIR